MLTLLSRLVMTSGSFLGLCLAGTATAQTLNVTIEIPVLEVAEYHRPYVAIWMADSAQQAVSNITVLYDTRMANQEGEKWLKDLRQWWRRSGRTLSLPVDGVTGATRSPGRHHFQQDLSTLSLAPGDYRLMIEAVREVGGRELVDIPFSWPVSDGHSQEHQGQEELGRITLSITH